MVNSRRLLLVLIAAAGAIKLVQSSCSVSGCQPDRCHCAPIVEPITLEAPSAAWSKQLKVVDDGCLANGGMIVCPLNDTAATIKGGLGSTDTSNKFTWASHELGVMPLPVVDLEGAVIATDGYTLAGYDPLGKVIGVTALHPYNGFPLDLTYTANGLVLIIYRCGMLTAYETNGIPDASIWINDTVDSRSGTFIPLLSPAFVLNRFYLLTAFWPHDETELDTYTVRLYAIDLRDVMVEKFKTAWYHQVTGKGHISSLKERFHSCTQKPSAAEKVVPPITSRSFVGGVMAVNDTIIAHVKITNSDGSDGGSVIISVNDTKNSYKKNFVSEADESSSSLLCIAHPPYQLKKGRKVLPVFLAAFSDKVHLMHQYEGTIAAKWNLLTTQLQPLTTPPLLLQSPASLDSFYVITGQGRVVVTSVTLKDDSSWETKEVWSLPIAGNRFATATDVNSNDTFLVVTTTDGELSAYQIY